MNNCNDIKIEQIMQTDVVKVDPDFTLYQISQLMDLENVGTVLVVDKEDKILGIITDRQIVVKAISYSLDPKTTKASEIMTTYPMAIFPNTTCKEALDIMGDYGYRRLPVEKDGKLVGIISINDLAQAVEFDKESLGDMIKSLSSDIRFT